MRLKMFRKNARIRRHARRHPALAAAAGLAAAPLLLLALAACGSAAPAQPRPAAAPATCTFGATSADVQVQIVNGAQSCARQLQVWAGDGQSWYPIPALAATGAPGAADQETMTRVCVLYSKGSVLTVEDTGQAFYGSQLCSDEEQAGWAP